MLLMFFFCLRICLCFDYYHYVCVFFSCHSSCVQLSNIDLSIFFFLFISRAKANRENIVCLSREMATSLMASCLARFASINNLFGAFGDYPSNGTQVRATLFATTTHTHTITTGTIVTVICPDQATAQRKLSSSPKNLTNVLVLMLVGSIQFSAEISPKEINQQKKTKNPLFIRFIFLSEAALHQNTPFSKKNALMF